MTPQHAIAANDVFCPRIKKVMRTLNTVVKLLKQNKKMKKNQVFRTIFKMVIVQYIFE